MVKEKQLLARGLLFFCRQYNNAPVTGTLAPTAVIKEKAAIWLPLSGRIKSYLIVPGRIK